jgi:hypothetical protein
MSIASCIVQCDPAGAWFDVLTDDGVIHRFHRTKRRSEDANPHVTATVADGGLRALLAKGIDRQPKLRQEAKGLPNVIVVDWPTPDLPGKLEYQQR